LPYDSYRRKIQSSMLDSRPSHSTDSVIVILSLSRRYRWGRPQVCNHSQSFREQSPWNRDLGKLERNVPTVPHDLGADLDQLVAQRRERSAFDLFSNARVRFWLQADLQSPEIDFRFTPESRHSRGHH